MKAKIEAAIHTFINECEALGVVPVFPIVVVDVVIWKDTCELPLDIKTSMYDDAYHELSITLGDIR